VQTPLVLPEEKKNATHTIERQKTDRKRDGRIKLKGFFDKFDRKDGLETDKCI
jgi:hypothetical protein